MVILYHRVGNKDRAIRRQATGTTVELQWMVKNVRLRK
jgi:hypothetical protein